MTSTGVSQHLSLQNHFHSLPQLIPLIKHISAYFPDTNYPKVGVKRCKYGQVTPLVKNILMLLNNVPKICDFMS